jgi:uncharacterized protein
MNLEQAKKDLLPIFKKHLDLHKVKVFVFGSQATGRFNPRSDIDIGLEGTEPINAKTISYIEEEIETQPYLVDVVDFSKVSNDFKDISKKKIILWTPNN